MGEPKAVFPVTLLTSGNEDLSWHVSAATPSDALLEAINRSGLRSGIYSVWDPDDPFGMPLVEVTHQADPGELHA